MVEALEIDPFDSNHFLYGTGQTIYGSHDLTSFPYVHISSLANGIEEESVQALISPPGIGAPLVSAVGDDCGFVHYNLGITPENTFEDPYLSTTVGLDYAGLSPSNIIRIGNSAGTAQLAISTNAGKNWTTNPAVPTTAASGTVALSADGKAIL